MAKPNSSTIHGYVLIARKIDDDKIMRQPPVVREAWFYILRRVNFKDGMYKSGQGFFTNEKIREALSWHVGNRKMTYSKQQVSRALIKLEQLEMIKKESVTLCVTKSEGGNVTKSESPNVSRGTLITVCNYATYQDPKQYERYKNKDSESYLTKKPTETPNVTDTLYRNRIYKEERILSPENVTNFSNISLNFFNHPEASNISEEILKTRFKKITEVFRDSQSYRETIAMQHNLSQERVQQIQIRFLTKIKETDSDKLKSIHELKRYFVNYLQFEASKQRV